MHERIDPGAGALGVGEELAEAGDGAGAAAPVVERDDDPAEPAAADREVDPRLAGVDADGRDLVRTERPPQCPAPCREDVRVRPPTCCGTPRSTRGTP